jgi:DNA-binding MarR family transcriptional regulator
MTRSGDATRLSAGDYVALAAFRRALRSFLAFSEDAARAAGLTPQQHQALLAIRGAPRGEDVTVGALAAWLGLRHHSTVELVDRLARHGLVERHPDPANRRRVLLTLTGAAAGVLEGLTEAHLRELHAIRPEFERLLSLLPEAGAPRCPPASR